MRTAIFVEAIPLLLLACDPAQEDADAPGDAAREADSPAESAGEADADPGEEGSLLDAGLGDTTEEAAESDGRDVAEAADDASAPRPWPDGSAISITEVHARLLAGDPEMHLLNVSDEEFYDLGHLPGSLVIPWDLLPGRLDRVSPGWHVVLYCRRGVRSAAAYETLAGAGYTQVWIMTGGLEAWIAAGLATVSCDDPSVTCL